MSTLYRKIADEITEDIAQGLYEPGHKIPSVRSLSKQRAVSISTVSQAYAMLEDRGLIHAKPQSGYFVCQGTNDPIVPPPTSKGSEPAQVTQEDLINQILSSCSKSSSVHLGAAIPDTSLLPYRALQSHIQKVSRYQIHESMEYQFTPGLFSLRSQIAARMRTVGVRCHPDDIIITQGCTDALALCLKASTQPQDIIAVESPCYYGFLQLAKHNHLQVVEIPTHPKNGISLDALKLALEQWPIKLILLSSRLSNPSGSSLSTPHQQALFELAQRYDVKILEDDIYGDLAFNRQAQSVIKHFDLDGRVMYCSSYSKTLSPGLRVGWCLPGKSMEQAKNLQRVSILSVNSLSQLVLSSYLQSGHYDKHIRKMRRICAENVERIGYAVQRYFPSGTQINLPNDSLMLWIRLPGDVSALDLQRRAMGSGINFMPGDLFSNSNEFNNYIRLNCALAMNERTIPAIKTLGEMITGKD